MVHASDEHEWSVRRAPLWDELSDLLDESARHKHRMSAERVDLLVLRYQQTAADLAFLRTQSPHSALIPRLNDVVARGHAAVYYRRSRISLRSVVEFVSRGYPRLVWRIRRYIYVIAALEIVFTLAGLIWALTDPVNAATFLPADLRDAAHFQHHAIPAGLMGVGATSIFTHNIVVSFVDLAGGLTAGVMTFYSVYLNSMLLGVLSGLTNESSLNSEYWSLILPHAVIELTAFTICGGAGLTIADAIVRAGPLPRSRAIRETGTRAVMIGLGTMPLLIVAGTIEGFITPSGLPIAVKIAVAPLTAVLLAAYLRRGRPARQATAGSAKVSPNDAVSRTPATV
jgi:uncharacterized membrane protein SpoIIM required for sporulation